MHRGVIELSSTFHALGPLDDKGRTYAVLVDASFSGTKTCGEIDGIRAIVGHENDDGVFSVPHLCDRIEQALERNVELRDHAIDWGDPIPPVGVFEILLVVPFAKLLRDIERRVRDVQRDVTEKRLTASLFHEADGFINEHVRAITLGLFESAVVEERRVPIAVTRVVRELDLAP